jgi:hypothetical protein
MLIIETIMPSIQKHFMIIENIFISIHGHAKPYMFLCGFWEDHIGKMMEIIRVFFHEATTITITYFISYYAHINLLKRHLKVLFLVAQSRSFHWRITIRLKIYK